MRLGFAEYNPAEIQALIKRLKKVMMEVGT